MQRSLFVALAGLALACGCDKKSEGTHPAADNTKLNERDRDRTKITPFDQGNNQADLDTTQNIRKAIMADDSLSMDGRNVKVITNAGVVTLRGPVKNNAERVAIETIARNYAGANRVDNQLEVAGPEGAQGR